MSRRPGVAARARYWWLGLALESAVIYTLSSMTVGDELPDPGIPGLDKLVHMALFAVWTGLLLGALRRTATRLAFTRVVVYSLAGAFLYGLSDELHQQFVPGRTPDVADLLADMIGALAAVTVATLWRRSRPAGEN